jgi:3-oxoacyl-[acyl-carrier-protein] synthase-3
MSATNGGLQAVRIAGMGMYLPEHIVRSEELDEAFRVAPGSTARATGVRERHHVRGETTEQMGASAARQALQAASLALEDVDVLIAAAASPRQLIPCTAVFMQRELGLPEGRSACFDVDATCLSWLVAIDIGAALIQAARAKVVLVITSETASCSLNPREPESAALFGDAAVASVLTRSPDGSTSRIGHTRFETHSIGADLAEFIGAGTRHHPNHPGTRPEMNMFHMQGRAIFKLARRVAPSFIDRFLQEAGVSRDEFDAVVPHQASRLGIEAITSHFGFRLEQVVTNLATRGNCIGASIPLALAEAVCSGRVRRGDRVLLIGTGAGLTLGAMDVVF